MFKPENVNDANRLSVITVSLSPDPLFKRKIANGEFLTPRPYSVRLAQTAKRIMKYDYGVPRADGSIRWSQKDSGMSYLNPSVTGGVKSQYDLVNQDVQYRLSKARNRMLGRLKKSSLGVLMMLNERKATAKLVVGTLDKLVQGIRYIRNPRSLFEHFRGRKPTAREKRRLRNIQKRSALHNTYGDQLLAYHFAWTPLFDDINDSLSAFDITTARLMQQSERAGFQDMAEQTAEMWSVCPYQLYLISNIRGEIKCWWDVDNDFAASLAVLQNPAAFAWDAVPWSFMLNWIANIGQWLDLQTATLGLKFVCGYESVKTVTKGVPTALSRYRADVNRYYRTTQVVPTRVDLSFTRRVLTDFPAPNLIMSKPTQLMDWFKVTILTGLLAQKIRTR